MPDVKRIRNITFKTPQVIASIVRYKREAWETVAREMDTEVHETIGVPVGVTRGPKGGVIKVRSAPGEPPRRDSGFLYKNTKVVFDKKKSSVVLKTPLYGGYLHGGTSRMAARPWVDVVFKFGGGEMSVQPRWNKRVTVLMREAAKRGGTKRGRKG